ncbi:MAG: DUF502 domain-containing protein, partial [Woeseiaceae bacterium]
RVLIGLMDRTLLLIPVKYRPEEWLGFAIPGLGLLLTLVVVLVTGLLAANIVGRSMVGLWESLLDRIPIVRSVYSASKNFTEIVFSDSSQSFKKVLLIEYPRRDCYSLAFQTATSLGEVQGRTGEEVICTFVPTTPNPTSGYLIIVPKKEVIELDMEIDEALKMIRSLGVVIPTWRKDQLAELPFELPEASRD